MSPQKSQETLVEEVLSGENPELQLLVAQGLFPLPADQLIALQVALAGATDSELAAEARKSLLEVEPRIAANVIREAEEAEEAERQVIAFYASQPSHPVILEAILRKRKVAAEILEDLARNLPTELQEILLLRQDAIVEHPPILDSLEDNPQLSAYASRRIKEYREHLLPRMKEAAPEEPEAVEAPEVSDGDVVEAVLEARDKPGEGEQDESTGLSEAQIRTLPVPVRLKLTRGASRSLRNILIKDSNPMVARAVLFGNAISDSEIEQIANSRVVKDEVLETIGMSRQFTRKYSVVHALVRNPRSPVGMAVRFVPRLAVRDLNMLRRDHNVSEAVRSTAARLYRIKQH